MSTSERFSPTPERFLTIHRARKRVPMKILEPPETPDVENMVDLHFHTSQGYQNEALATAKFASTSGMRALLVKSYRQLKDPYTGKDVARLAEALNEWCKQQGVKPVTLVAGYIVCHNPKSFSFDVLKENLEDGVGAVWFPVANALRSWTIVGPEPDSAPLSREEALARGGITVIDDNGELRPEFKTYVEMVAEYDRALFFGHRSHEELFAAAEYAHSCGIPRLVVDHPFSPFIDLNIEQMQALAKLGVKFNYTYNEISPVGGVDPQHMADAVKAVGAEHFTLSSDAGDYLFPSSVECLRLLKVTLGCYGVSDDELKLMGEDNGAFILGLD